MILHNTIQVVSYTAKKVAGQSVGLKRNAAGALVVRSAHGHSGGFVLRTRHKRRRRLKLLMASFAALALLFIAGLVAMDQAVAARSAAGAAAGAGHAAVWNADFSSDVMFMAGLPVFAVLAAAQVLLLIQIRENIRK